MSEEIKCEHCGKVVADEDELEIWHRACRLKACFPEAVTDMGGGIVSFDMNKIKEQLNRDDTESKQ